MFVFEYVRFLERLDSELQELQPKPHPSGGLLPYLWTQKFIHPLEVFSRALFFWRYRLFHLYHQDLS
jgi:hypothetical protein